MADRGHAEDEVVVATVPLEIADVTGPSISVSASTCERVIFLDLDTFPAILRYF